MPIAFSDEAAADSTAGVSGLGHEDADFPAFLAPGAFSSLMGPKREAPNVVSEVSTLF